MESGVLRRVSKAHEQDISSIAHSKQPRQSSLLEMRWQSGLAEEVCIDKSEVSESSALYLAILTHFMVSVPKIVC